MRTILIKTTTGYLAIAALVACPFVSSETSAMSSRDAFTITSTLAKGPTVRTQVHPLNVDKNPGVARISPVKTEAVATTTAPKEKKIEEKKTISRCWKRLMNMAREIRYAHRKSSK